MKESLVVGSIKKTIIKIHEECLYSTANAFLAKVVLYILCIYIYIYILL